LVLKYFRQPEQALAVVVVVVAQSANLQRCHLQHHPLRLLQLLARPQPNRTPSPPQFPLEQRSEPHWDSHQSLVPEVLRLPLVVAVAVAVAAAVAAQPQMPSWSLALAMHQKPSKEQ
jgi:hypothetical protein